MRKIVCKNEDGITIAFTYEEDAEFSLDYLEGASYVKNKVTMSENTMMDGATYQGSTLSARNIVIYGFIDGDYRRRREALYRCFKKGATGTFVHIEDGVEKTIDYKVESIYIDDVGVIRNVNISLLCADPYFKDTSDTRVMMAGWQKLFTWPHQFTSEKEAFGNKLRELIKAIVNDSAADDTGIEILMEATNYVKNPVLYHLEKEEFIKVGNEDMPLELNVGDSVRITTGTNEKNVYVIRNGTETKINEYLDEDSEFIQLKNGTNTFRYDAYEGAENLDVTITYRRRYMGV